MEVIKSKINGDYDYNDSCSKLSYTCDGCLRVISKRSELYWAGAPNIFVFFWSLGGPCAIFLRYKFCLTIFIVQNSLGIRYSQHLLFGEPHLYHLCNLRRVLESRSTVSSCFLSVDAAP